MCLITKASHVHFVWYTRCFVSDGLKLRMPFWKCHFELYARRFGNLECLPTPCFPNMIKNLKFPDILQVSGLFLLQSDRLTAWVNIKAHGPKHFYQRLEKGKNAENLAYSTIFQSRTWTCSGNKLVKPENI